MSFGLIGSADLAATTNTLIGGAALGTSKIVNIRIANRNSTEVAVQVAIGTGSSPAVADYIDYNTVVKGFSILEDSGFVCKATEKIWAYSDTANVTVRAMGFPTLGDFLGSADLVAATPTLLFTAAVDLTSNIRFCNRNLVDAAVRVAIGTGGSPVAKDWITYDSRCAAKGCLEELGIPVSSGEKVWVQSDLNSVSVRAHYM